MTKPPDKAAEHRVWPRPESYWPHPIVLMAGSIWAVVVFGNWALRLRTFEGIVGTATGWLLCVLLGYLYFLHSPRSRR